jgi:uncharacterized protein YbjT (DUF2867 family)
MNVLLTGGTGYVGAALRERLAGRGHSVRLLVRRESGGTALRAGGFTRAEDFTRTAGFTIAGGDVLDTNSCLRACAGCDAVVHLVGIIREYPRYGITFDELHVRATENIVAAAERQGVKRFVHMSALGSREDAVSTYHKTKYAAESIVRHSALAWTIFRPSVIFDRGSEFIETLVQLAGRRIVPLIGGGSARLQPVARADVAACMAACLTMPGTRGRVFELGGADRLAFKDLLRMIAAHRDGNPKMIALPAFLMKPIVRAMERFPSFPLTSDQLTMLLEDNLCDTAEAERVFGFAPASFIRALPELLE